MDAMGYSCSKPPTRSPILLNSIEPEQEGQSATEDVRMINHLVVLF